MSSQEQKPASDLLAAKRAAVLESRGTKRKLMLPLIGLALLVGLGGFFGLRMMPEEKPEPEQESFDEMRDMVAELEATAKEVLEPKVGAPDKDKGED